MNVLALIGIFLGALAFGCCWFDYREIKRLKKTLDKKTMDIYDLERRIENLESNSVRLCMSIDEHDARIREFEGDSYEE